ncbi:MAG TPA: ABC transporter permease, partial [Vicinamibacterales bacterium]|nr:ABC transporter permease [Vicinamibacterales bacterium]
MAASSEMSGFSLNINEGGQRQRAYVQFVSGNYFDVLGIPAIRGRVFHDRPRSDGREPIAVISYDYWQRHYAGAASALGSRIGLNRLTYTVAGITPPGFRGLEVDVPVDFWVDVDDSVSPNDPDRTHGLWMR